jgi:hypothetical protein
VLTRFLFSSEQFAKVKNLVKAKAFFPDARGETSVFRVVNLNVRQIWALGSGIRSESPKARGDFVTEVAIRHGLRVETAPEDHARHAVLVGWPIAKYDKQAIALELSRKSSLHLP